MHPVLFTLFGFKFYSYGVMVALAFLAGLWMMAHRARKQGDNPDIYLEATIWFIIAGLGGARLFYFIWYPELFFADPVQALLSQGGLVWYGGVIGVCIAGMLYAWLKKIKLAHFADIISPSGALGLAIGRIGCVLSGCCYGAFCKLPWAIKYPITHETGGFPVHPVQLYETVIMLFVTGVLLKLDKNKPFDGFTTGWFFILASITRFALEYIRGDRLVWIEALNLSASQVVSVGGIILGIIILLVAKVAVQVKDASLKRNKPL